LDYYKGWYNLWCQVNTPFYVKSQKSHKLDIANNIRIQPDLVLFKEGQPYLVIDAKYKVESAQDDIYQMVAYCHGVGVKSAILIHPKTEDILQNLFMIKGPGDISIEYMSLNLKGLSHELELNAKELISHIRRKYVDQTTSDEPISAII